jgi:hypothetical protein
MRSARLTPLGFILIALLIGGLVLASVGSKDAQDVGFVVAVIAGLMLIGASLSKGSYGGAHKTMDERREEFHPIDREDVPPPPPPPPPKDTGEQPPNPFGR